jgi:hypothetical protein
VISLSALLGKLVAIIQSHHLCRRIEVVETKIFSAEQFFFKVRAELSGEYNFQVRIYYNRGHIDYAYQLFTDVPLLRWDNKEEFPALTTCPHHHHDKTGNVVSSPLKGDPIKDIEIVLDTITAFISTPDVK